MGPARILIAVTLALLLGGLGQAGASLVANPDDVAARLDAFTAADGQAAAAAACAASQCDLLEQQSAVRALAVTAGASVPQSDRPAVLPDRLWAQGGASIAVAKPGADVAPVLFAVIAPTPVANGQICVEEGNLLGLAPTCRSQHVSLNSFSSSNCPNGGFDRFGRKSECERPGDTQDPCPNGPGFDRFGMKVVCRIGDAPEPGTPLLLAIALLGLAAIRVRSTRRKASPARL